MQWILQEFREGRVVSRQRLGVRLSSAAFSGDGLKHSSSSPARITSFDSPPIGPCLNDQMRPFEFKSPAAATPSHFVFSFTCSQYNRLSRFVCGERPTSLPS